MDAQCEIAKKFFEMISAITTKQKIPQEYSDGQILYHSEIDLLEKISQNPRINASELSRQFGVTRSAVTQMSSRLLEKGLIEKYSINENKKEKYFRLTAAGEAAQRLHLEYHRDASEEMRDYLCSLDAKEKEIIIQFMEKMQKCMPVCAFPCNCNVQSCAMAAKR